VRRGVELARRANAVDAELSNLRWLAVSLALEDPLRTDEAERVLATLDDRVREIGDPVQRAKTMAIESIRQLQPETLARARAFSVWISGYASLVTSALHPPGRSPSSDDIELAFQVMERTRSRAMLDEMDAARVTGALLDSSDPRVSSRRQLLQAIAGVQRQLLDPSLADLRGSLSPDEAFLAFQVYSLPGGEISQWTVGSHLLVVTRDDVRAYDLPPADEIESTVELFVGLFANRDGSERGPSANRLFADLLDDAVSDLGPQIRHLAISPDGVLHRLPFAGLLEAAFAEDDRQPPTVSLVPSAASLVRWRSRPPQDSPRLALGLFDPEARPLAPSRSGAGAHGCRVPAPRPEPSEDTSVAASGRPTTNRPPSASSSERRSGNTPSCISPRTRSWTSWLPSDPSFCSSPVAERTACCRRGRSPISTWTARSSCFPPAAGSRVRGSPPRV
jgi:hypothetical protein